MIVNSWYNGYSPKERDEKYRELKRLINIGKLKVAIGPCDLCCDPDVDVEYHDEDYGKPYIWTKPALLCLCRHCHRTKLHKRFKNISNWFTIKETSDPQSGKAAPYGSGYAVVKEIIKKIIQEDESLHKWFKRQGAKGKTGGWVDCNAPDGKGGYKACGRKEGEKRSKYPACRPTPAGCKAKGKGTKWGKTK